MNPTAPVRPGLPIPGLSRGRIAAASLVAALGLVVVGWFDYAATRGELLGLLREQAVSLRETIAAAARSNESARLQAEAQMSERLLDNARLLAEIDGRGALDQRLLDRVARQNALFRVGLFSASGVRELASAGGGPPGAGRGFQGSQLVQRLLQGNEEELVEMHAGRREGAVRMAAAVRRPRGGAIMLNVDATGLEALRQQVSLDSLLHDIVASTPQLAYVMLEREGQRLAHGVLPADLPPAPAPNAGTLIESAVEVNGHPVLEFTGLLAGARGEAGVLRLGLRLDGLRRAEQRTLIRLIASLAGALLLSLVALGSVWLRQAYGALSEKHAAAEAALRRRDRLSAMGELASTVAHEVRNPLNAIAMSAQRLRREFLPAVAAIPDGDRAELEQLLAVNERETARINDIVQQFLEFARPPKLALEPVNLAELAGSVAVALRPSAAARSVTLDGPPEGAAIQAVADPVQLRQAIDNLVRNAIEATPADGRVSVSVRHDGKLLAVEVRDTGSGIDPADLPRIFDLYFTTKPAGTGVGLAVTQQIVSAHGGTIEVAATPGAGTIMTIRLPRDPSEVTGA